ncbi:MAG TPA: uroporphyrinogen decarboxylase family protein [Anaerolineales bacterium]|nr:uroporphyrinogen decarboxylase family protein [Anaerolineales bacterium]
MTQRQAILDLFSGKKMESQPAFSGLIHVTAEGLQSEGITLYEAHHDAQKMARAAASTFHLTGMPSAALPLDLCAPAEALGAELNYYENVDNQFPQPAKSLFASTAYLTQAYFESADFINRGRLPIICEAIRALKADIRSEAVISAIVPGPYTLLLYLIEPGGLFAEMKREPNVVQDALLQLSSFLSQVGIAYRDAGADFITIHDMGGSPGFIGPAKYEQFVYPAQKLLMEELPAPRVLSVCGNTNKSMQLLAQTDADAISVDQTNDLAASRAILTDTLLFGNIDPVAALWQGTEVEIREAVQKAKETGVDAVWPGCDLVQQTSIENLKAFLAAS